MIGYLVIPSFIVTLGGLLIWRGGGLVGVDTRHDESLHLIRNFIMLGGAIWYHWCHSKLGFGDCWFNG